MRPTVATLPAVERMDNQVVGIMPQIPVNGKWALGLQVCLMRSCKSTIFYILILLKNTYKISDSLKTRSYT